MAGPIPSTPNNFLVQTGNGSVYLNWSQSISSTAYYVLRSTDGINYSQIAATSSLQYYDTSASTGLLTYYQIQAASSAGISLSTAPQVLTPVNWGLTSLGSVRLASQQRADMISSNFVTIQEWNDYISKSYKELYDILVQVYADEYYVAAPYQFLTDGRVPALYPLPNNFYKMLGEDLALNQANNAFLTLRKFTFKDRNKFVYGNTPVSFLGFLSLKYRIVGNNILFIPQPTGNQLIQLWYVPRPAVLMADSDTLDGVSGWEEYIIVDAARKALIKEESFDMANALMAEKTMLEQRIRAAASNRDASFPESVTDVRGLSGYDMNMSDQPWGGW